MLLYYVGTVKKRKVNVASLYGESLHGIFSGTGRDGKDILFLNVISFNKTSFTLSQTFSVS